MAAHIAAENYRGRRTRPDHSVSCRCRICSGENQYMIPLHRSAEVGQLASHVEWHPRCCRLESTIITHGMPYPQNTLEVARQVESRTYARPVLLPANNCGDRTGGCTSVLEDKPADGAGAEPRMSAKLVRVADMAACIATGGYSWCHHGCATMNRRPSGRRSRFSPLAGIGGVQ